MVFIDLEKAYDCVPREVLWKTSEKKGVRVTYIQSIQGIYNGVTISMRTPKDKTRDYKDKNTRLSVKSLLV